MCLRSVKTESTSPSLYPNPSCQFPLASISSPSLYHLAVIRMMLHLHSHSSSSQQQSQPTHHSSNGSMHSTSSLFSTDNGGFSTTTSAASRSSAGSSFTSRGAFGSTGIGGQTFDQERALSAALKGAYDDVIMQYAGHAAVLQQQPQPQAHHYPPSNNNAMEGIRSASLIGATKEAPRILPTLLQLTSQGIPGTVITAPIIPSSSSRKQAPAAAATTSTTSTLSMASSSASTASSATVLPAVLQKQKRSRYTLNDFSFNRTLGTGSFGRVHLGKLQEDKERPPSSPPNASNLPTSLFQCSSINT